MNQDTQVDFYLRLSIDREGKDSLERQEADLRAWADREGLTVRKVWQDAGKSGYKAGVVREDFDKAIKAVESGDVATLAVWKLDRLSRRGAGQVGLVLDAVEEAGGRLFFLNDSLDSTMPGHRSVIVMVSEQARTESANTSLRVRSKIASDLAEGKPKGGVRPLGWEPGGMSIREAEAWHIREACRSVLEDGATVWGIAQRWNAAGLQTDHMARGKGRAWTTTTVRQVLKRPRNAGILMHKGTELPNSQIEPLLTREDWEALCATIKGAKQDTGPKPRYLLGGILKCICGATMHATTSITARKGKAQRRYKIYRCRMYGFDKTQKHVTVTQPAADSAVREWIVESIGLAEGAAPGYDKNHLARVQAKLAALTAEEERTTDALLDGIGKAQRIKGRLRNIQTERAALTAERDATLAESAYSAALAAFRDRMSDLPDLSPDADVDAALAEGFAAWDALSMDDQRSIIRGGYRVTITAGGRGVERVEVTSS